MLARDPWTVEQVHGRQRRRPTLFRGSQHQAILTSTCSLPMPWSRCPAIHQARPARSRTRRSPATAFRFGSVGAFANAALLSVARLRRGLPCSDGRSNPSRRTNRTIVTCGTPCSSWRLIAQFSGDLTPDEPDHVSSRSILPNHARVTAVAFRRPRAEACATCTYGCYCGSSGSSRRRQTTSCSLDS